MNVFVSGLHRVTFLTSTNAFELIARFSVQTLVLRHLNWCPVFESFECLSYPSFYEKCLPSLQYNYRKKFFTLSLHFTLLLALELLIPAVLDFGIGSVIHCLFHKTRMTKALSLSPEPDRLIHLNL